MAGEPEALFLVEDRMIDTPEGGISIRIYRPSDRRDLPVTVYFHGGWFFMGDLDTHDAPLRALAKAAGSVVIAVNYRLAPEHPFPAGINDGSAAFQWIATHATELGIDASRMALAGDSAGGALATTTARRAAHGNGPKPLLQVLIYPVTDSSLSTGSWEEFSEGPVITRNNAAQSWAMYVPDINDRQNPDAAPLFATDLAGVAPALVIAAEYDPLRDEVLAYAQKLKKAGVPVKESLYKGMPHGFFQLGGYIDEGKAAIAEVAAALTAAFARD